MGRTIAGVDLGAELLSAFGDDAEDIKLLRVMPAGDGPDVDGPPVAVKTVYACRGYTEAVRYSRVPDSLVRDKMKVFGIYGDSLPVEPQTDDILRHNSQEYLVYHVDGDSVGGVWCVYAQYRGAC